MSWIDQGRQEHGRFGHGKAPVPLDGISSADRAELGARMLAVTEFAAERVDTSDPLLARNLRRFHPALKVLVPVWAGGVDLAPNAFRTTFIGAEADSSDAWLMQRAVLAVTRADTHAGLKGAGAELAAAGQSVGARAWPKFIMQAGEQTVEAQAQIMLAAAPAAATQPQVPNAASSAELGDAAPYSPDREGWHDYTQVSKEVCPADLQCTKEEMADYMSRFGVPGHDPSIPLQNQHPYWVHDPSTGAPVGMVITRISPDGLTVINTTLKMHILYNGQIVRAATQEDDGLWTVTIHGTGNNVLPGMATLNQDAGPGIFQTMDDAMRSYIQHHETHN